VLGPYAGVLSVRPDVFYAHRNACDRAEGDAGPQDLAASFAEGAVDGYHVNI
jgi:hypothetical protein